MGVQLTGEIHFEWNWRQVCIIKAKTDTTTKLERTTVNMTVSFAVYALELWQTSSL